MQALGKQVVTSIKALNQTLHVVRYCGPFGFIKPWTAVRDGETFSQQFLTPSIVEGMRQKLEVAAILRHRLRYAARDTQQEQTQPLGWTVKTRDRLMTRPRSIVTRGVLLSPVLYLAFATREDAEKAATQHLCLCRNEDLIYPDEAVERLSTEEFDRIAGFELLFEEGADSLLVGYDRFAGGQAMKGWLLIVGDPLSAEEEMV